MTTWPDLFVTASHYAGVFRGGRRLEPLHEGAGMYHGVTWHEGAVAVTARCGIMHPFPLEGVRWIEPGTGEVIGCLPFPFAELHQIYFDPIEWHLYTTSAYFDQVLRVGPDFEVVHHGNGDRHVNSVWCRGDAIWIIEHNRTRLTGIKSRVIRGNLKTGEATTRFLGREAHNVFCDASGLYTVSSMDGAILRCRDFDDSEAPPDSFPITDTYYPRGLAVVDDRIIVGGSRVGSRDVRHDHRTEGRLFLLDRRTLRVLDDAEIPGAGQIGQVRALRGDEAGNGLDYPGG